MKNKKITKIVKTNAKNLHKKPVTELFPDINEYELSKEEIKLFLEKIPTNRKEMLVNFIFDNPDIIINRNTNWWNNFLFKIEN